MVRGDDGRHRHQSRCRRGAARGRALLRHAGARAGTGDLRARPAWDAAAVAAHPAPRRPDRDRTNGRRRDLTAKPGMAENVGYMTFKPRLVPPTSPCRERDPSTWG